MRPLSASEPIAAPRVASLRPAPAAVAGAGPAALAVDGLVKRFPGRGAILDGVDLRLRDGERLALIGGNGAGKSTLLRCCLRLIEPDAGDVRLLGSELRGLRAGALRRVRARVGFVFQRHNLVPRLSALSNVVHGAQARRAGPRGWIQALAPRRLREEAMHCLDQVGLAPLARQRADRLSGGQSQRVAIARMLMQVPDLVIADEPVASLDPSAGEEVMELFVRLMAERHVTLLFTSHNLQHTVTYADRVVGLRGGRVVLDVAADRCDAAALKALYV